MTTLLEGLIEAIKVTDAGVPTGPLAGRVFRAGHVPDLDKVNSPYAEVHYPMTDPPALRGDHRTMAREPDAQVDVWIPLADEKDHDGLWEEVRDLLDAAAFAGYGGKVNACVVVDTVRMPTAPEDEGWLRHSILLRIAHVPPPPP